MERESTITAEFTRYVSVRSAAELLDVNPATVRRWVADGVLAAVRIGRKTLRIDIASIKAEPIHAAVAA
ncbi:MAG: helix-turn-helix domain-containing protein [Nocardiaceae bacterium]|nr:helix-turn-helix domain-containing protein [Nocardiaceae bacterium]